ncbi:SGNH/GDSL hydrolase family protein [Pedobacter foliorum]|uniref:SGNH/GDSL hydrolase family protein n=1 Tax=Pedobacter foliorum TaxID=2739058 RepID=UPI001565EDC8|nr:SGNH/GDSL hydrolase family protein [Pedobacter foliorum]NRF41441.1 acylhydrolase [Pedobacter foliorum]
MKIISKKWLVIPAILFSIQFTQAQDWANLKRYQEENAKLSAPAKNESRVVFMGNSITEGWKNNHPEFFTVKPYICRGISGQTTPQMLIRFHQDVVALKPKVVVMLCGINDIAGNTGPSTLEMIEDNISAMTEIARANNIKVVLSSVLPAFAFPWKPEVEPADKVIALNKWIKAYAEKNKLIYVDYFSAMKDERNGLPKSLAEDGIHPNKAGYAIMEPLVEQGIAKALKQK